MATLGSLTTQAALALADSGGGTWPEATVRAWLWEALQDYSVYFHRTTSVTLDCAAGDHDYDLPDDCAEVLLVEYPAGDDPPHFLRRGGRTAAAWWRSSAYYDVEPGDQSAGADAVLWISAEAAAGETIRVLYRADYYVYVTGGAGDLVTVPEPHHPILIQYVVWRAATERYAYEIQQPDPTTIILEQLGHNAERQRRIYDQQIDRALAGRSRSAAAGPWTDDAYDRIY